jgi:serine/threonine protein kinase
MSYCLNATCSHPENLESVERCASCGSLLLLNGRYRAVKLVGTGGFGRTFLAIDQAQPFKPRCAVKQLLIQPTQLAPNQTAVARFYDEGKQLSALGKHPQLPQALAFFEQEQAWYLVQEWVEGRNLSTILQEEGVFNPGQIRQLLHKMLPVLAFIHEHQLIHRDIKPQNVIYRQSDDRPVLVDFGAAKLSSRHQLAQTGTVIGTAEYAAPEQVSGKAVFASDIYSMGVTSIHLLTGVSPLDLFDHKRGTWVWRDFLKSPLQDVALGKILDRMIQQALDLRYPSATAVLQNLQAGAFPINWQITIPRWRLWGGVALTAMVAGGLGISWLHTQSQPQMIAEPTVSFQPTPPVSTEQLLSTKECTNCDLSNVNLSGMNLSGANLRGANLTGANLSNANLSGAVLEGAILEDVNLSSSNLAGANFISSNLTNANFSNANLSGVSLESAILTGANFNQADVTGVRGNTQPLF